VFFSPIQGEKMLGHLSDVAFQNLPYLLHHAVGTKVDMLKCAGEGQGYNGILPYVLQGASSSWE
jgi:hypothetical protein